MLPWNLRHGFLLRTARCRAAARRALFSCVALLSDSELDFVRGGDRQARSVFLPSGAHRGVVQRAPLAPQLSGGNLSALCHMAGDWLPVFLSRGCFSVFA